MFEFATLMQAMACFLAAAAAQNDDHPWKLMKLPVPRWTFTDLYWWLEAGMQQVLAEDPEELQTWVVQRMNPVDQDLIFEGGDDTRTTLSECAGHYVVTIKKMHGGEFVADDHPRMQAANAAARNHKEEASCAS